MNRLDRRFLTIMVKWISIVVVVIYLWHFGFFYVLFVGIPWLITYEVGLVLEYGFGPVLTDHGFMWMLAGASVVFLIVFEFYTHYRHKRRDLRVGGQFEGRVVWARGIRQGLLYDLWDAKNYLAWRSGTKKGGASPMITSRGTIRTVRGTWPDPFAIPIGERNDGAFVIYHKKRFLQLIPDKLYVSRDVDVVPSFFNYWLPNLRIVTEPHPDKPGLVVYRLVDRTPKKVDAMPSKVTEESARSLDRSHGLVEKAILSDAETKKRDFEHGSFAVHPAKREEVWD